jgi:nicotinamidase-related amidase
MTESALILIDIQQDYFPGGAWEVPGMEAAAAQAARALAAARAAGLPVLHVRHEATSPAAPFFRPGTAGAEIAAAVAPAPGETVITKHRPNAFLGTGLAEILAERGAKHLVFAGAMSQMCIDASVRAAVDLGLRATVLSDACAARAQSFAGREVAAEDVHAAVMAALSGTYARLSDTASAIAGDLA